MTSSIGVRREWDEGRRLQPWVVYDLERVAWIVEPRADEFDRIGA